MAAKEYVWNIQVDDIAYKVKLTKNRVSINDGEAVKIGKYNSKSKFPNTEYYIPLGGQEVVLNMRQSGEPILTLDGRDCNTGEMFTLEQMPKWGWIFVVLHAINFFVVIGGAIGGALCGAFAFISAGMASNSKRSTGTRVLLCIGVWVLATVIELIIALMFTALFY